MNLEKHLNLNIYDKALPSLGSLYKEQVPSSIFMFLIGVAASLTMMLFDNSIAGKNAGTLLQSMTSGLSQLKIFIAVSTFLLLFSSVVKLNHNFNNDESHMREAGYLANISNRGLFSFLVPYSALIFAVGLVTLVCLKTNPHLAHLQDIKINDAYALFTSAFILIIFLGMFYFASLLESFAISRIGMAIVTFIFFIIFLITIFDIAK